MAVSHGMDIAEIEAFGNRLQQHFSTQLNSIADELETVVGQTSSSWVGPDGEKFRSWWPAKRSAIRATADDVHGFGQSALNNASEQRNASGDRASSPGVGTRDWIPVPSVPGTPDLPPIEGRVVLPGGRAWQDVQKEYDAWATGRFADPKESQYQCTGWANFRWQQLGYKGDISGHGGAMAGNAGPTTSDPSLHAMASYRSGEYGHVMIVEEVTNGGNTIRVSEMNTGTDGSDANNAHPREYRDTRVYTRGVDNKFRSNGHELEFAAFPG
jgi:uncharacterized protein YukE